MKTHMSEASTLVSTIDSDLATMVALMSSLQTVHDPEARLEDSAPTGAAPESERSESVTVKAKKPAELNPGTGSSSEEDVMLDPSRLGSSATTKSKDFKLEDGKVVLKSTTGTYDGIQLEEDEATGKVTPTEAKKTEHSRSLAVDAKKGQISLVGEKSHEDKGGKHTNPSKSKESLGMDLNLGDPDNPSLAIKTGESSETGEGDTLKGRGVDTELTLKTDGGAVKMDFSDKEGTQAKKTSVGASVGKDKSGIEVTRSRTDGDTFNNTGSSTTGSIEHDKDGTTRVSAGHTRSVVENEDKTALSIKGGAAVNKEGTLTEFNLGVDASHKAKDPTSVATSAADSIGDLGKAIDGPASKWGGSAGGSIAYSYKPQKPVQKGEQWLVSYTRTWKGEGNVGASKGKGSGSLKVHGGKAETLSKLYATFEEADAAYQQMMKGNPPPAGTLGKGETKEVTTNFGGEATGTAKLGGVEIGLTGGAESKNKVVIEGMGRGFIDVELTHSLKLSAGLSISAIVGFEISGSETDLSGFFIRFDTNTEDGALAYNLFEKSGTLPPSGWRSVGTKKGTKTEAGIAIKGPLGIEGNTRRGTGRTDTVREDLDGNEVRSTELTNDNASTIKAPGLNEKFETHVSSEIVDGKSKGMVAKTKVGTNDIDDSARLYGKATGAAKTPEYLTKDGAEASKGTAETRLTPEQEQILVNVLKAGKVNIHDGATGATVNIGPILELQEEIKNAGGDIEKQKLAIQVFVKKADADALHQIREMSGATVALKIEGKEDVFGGWAAIDALEARIKKVRSDFESTQVSAVPTIEACEAIASELSFQMAKLSDTVEYASDIAIKDKRNAAARIKAFLEQIAAIKQQASKRLGGAAPANDDRTDEEKEVALKSARSADASAAPLTTASRDDPEVFQGSSVETHELAELRKKARGLKKKAASLRKKAIAARRAALKNKTVHDGKGSYGAGGSAKDELTGIIFDKEGDAYKTAEADLAAGSTAHTTATESASAIIKIDLKTADEERLHMCVQGFEYVIDAFSNSIAGFNHASSVYDGIYQRNKATMAKYFKDLEKEASDGIDLETEDERAERQKKEKKQKAQAAAARKAAKAKKAKDAKELEQLSKKDPQDTAALGGLFSRTQGLGNILYNLIHGPDEVEGSDRFKGATTDHNKGYKPWMAGKSAYEARKNLTTATLKGLKMRAGQASIAHSNLSQALSAWQKGRGRYP
jgi:hypothetical protein